MVELEGRRAGLGKMSAKEGMASMRRKWKSATEVDGGT